MKDCQVNGYTHKHTFISINPDSDSDITGGYFVNYSALIIIKTEIPTITRSGDFLGLESVQDIVKLCSWPESLLHGIKHGFDYCSGK